MTGMLQDLLRERADELGAPPIDLEEITRAGDRRVRRRRTAWAGGVAAAFVVTTAAGVSLLSGIDAGGRDSKVTDGTDARPVALSWVTGQTLHRAGASDVDLGSPVRAWVWAEGAVAFLDTDRKVRTWDGSSTAVLGAGIRVNSDNSVRELVADGARVAWVDANGQFTVHDLDTGEEERTPVQGSDPQVTALDGDTLYAVDERGVLAWHLDTGTVKVLDRDRAHIVQDAESGTIVQATDGDRRARVIGPGRNVTLTVDSFANLSPDGAMVMAESDDEGIILDTSTGERLLIDDGHEWALPYQWLDNDTVAVLAFDGVDTEAPDEEAHLQTCSVSEGTCTGADVDLSGELGSWQLPIGIAFAE